MEHDPAWKMYVTRRNERNLGLFLQVKEERIGGVERTRMSLKRESWSSKKMDRVSKPQIKDGNNASWVSQQLYWKSFKNFFIFVF